MRCWGFAGAGALAAGLRSHARTRHGDSGSPGATIHAARYYDWLVVLYTFGRADWMRQRTLDVAGVAVGDAVLDVGCGTGTLALLQSGGLATAARYTVSTLPRR